MADFESASIPAVSGRVVIYGGKGALGSACVDTFISKNWWVGSIDTKPNCNANENIVVNIEQNCVEQEQIILAELKGILGDNKLDGIICVAGGWAGGDAANKDFIKNSDLMWKQSVWSSIIAAKIASQYLKEGGFLALTGAKAALEGTPGMIGYGMAKAAVHHLTKSLATEKGGLPAKSLVACILPSVLDTKMNRKLMPKADDKTWTPLNFISELFWKWTKVQERPLNGSLLHLVTKDYKTEVIPV
ncbi:PREDICTED: dihydropteridine reductase [Ceratosolen solmsi marchali]|uniref:Dihydropteridine reductase n=1 Tax=Ceratosolen solmsi marchali TaxID=326594 RepID=A0AAJ7E1P9_9HYME|nr:PREDICTED: dihydropteridine reductase [Ceratosolen solmsi marchali]